MVTWIKSRIEKLLDLIEQVDPFEAALYLTLLIFMLEKTDLHSLILLCSLGILVRPFLRHPVYWFLLATVFVVVSWNPWYSPGNHRHLQAYWCLAIAFCYCCENPQEALAKSTRWLIVLTFLFALIWKIRTPEFLDGSFLEYTLISDYRFIPVAMVLGIDADTVLQNRVLLNDFLNVGDLSGTVSIETNNLVPIVAKFLTGWTLLIEALVCVLFFLPTNKIGPYWRHIVLLVFIISTYSIAPVVGFGWLLSAMGVSLLRLEEKRKLLPFYVIAFVIVFLGRNPGIHRAIEHLERLFS